MASEGVTRRLVAILAADVAGYTRQVEEDTDGTVAAWQAARADIIDPHHRQTLGPRCQTDGRWLPS